MDYIYVVNVILWLVIGAMNLASVKIDKFSYGLMWIVLTVNLIDDCVKAFAT